ncbi:MAG: TolC family protein [Cytophagaceae bacterium]|jgi:outer membrane protein TolC|nr:TolC family protein [Cytophagaceae bacterium]
MKKLFLILSCTLLLNVQAQSTWTLEQCIAYGLQHQESFKNAQIDQQLAAQKVKQSHTQLLPQVKAVADLRDNLILPTNILPGALAGLPSDQTLAVQFGQQYNATAALDANWTLYDPGVSAGLKSLKKQIDISEQQKTLLEKTIRLQVSQAYYALWLAQERLAIQRENVSHKQIILKDAQLKRSQEQLTDIQLQKAEWEFKNQEAEVESASLQVEQAIFQLRYQMGFPADSVLVIQTILPPAPQESVGSLEMERRPEWAVLKLQLDQEVWNQRRYKRSYLPTLSAYGYLGSQSFRPQFDFFSSNARWYGVSYIGLKATLPVFDGMLKARQIQESTLLKEKKNNEINAFQKQYSFEVENAKKAMESAQKNMQIRNNNLQFVKDQYKNTQVKAEQGLLTSADMSQAALVLEEAQSAYFNALHQYLQARLEFDRVK